MGVLLISVFMEKTNIPIQSKVEALKINPKKFQSLDHNLYEITIPIMLSIKNNIIAPAYDCSPLAIFLAIALSCSLSRFYVLFHSNLSPRRPYLQSNLRLGERADRSSCSRGAAFT